MESDRGLGGIFGRVAAPFRRRGASEKDEEELIHAVIQRIEVPSEPPLDPQKSDAEDMYKRLVGRLSWQLRRAGIGAEELVRVDAEPVRAVVLLKTYEKAPKGESAVKERLTELGFKVVHAGLYILPPDRVPPGLASENELKIWVRREVTKPLGKRVDFVLPLVAVVDLRLATVERKGIRKMPMARTFYSVLEPEEVVPFGHVYAMMKSRGASVKEIILSGDLVFLASCFAEGAEVEAIKQNYDDLVGKLKHATGSTAVRLEDIANLGPDTIAETLKGLVKHPVDLAKRMIVEAQYWMRFLGGSVPE